MAVDISFLSEAMPIWAFVLVFVLAYAILAKTKILGSNKWINSIISIILAIIFTTFTGVREYLTNLTPWLVVLVTISFFFLLLIAFMLKDDWTKITKPITIILVIIFALVIIITIFYTFPATQALLPNAIVNPDSDSNTNYCNSDYTKTKVYDYDSYYYKDCEKNGDYYRCDDNENSGTYDRCIKYGSEYRCQDNNNRHYEYEYTNKNCEDNNNDDNSNDNIFDNIGNYIYKDKITNAFWLLLIAIVVAIIITRK